METKNDQPKLQKRYFINPVVLGILVIVHSLSCFLEEWHLAMPVSGLTALYSLLAMLVVTVQIVFTIKHFFQKNSLYKQHLLSLGLAIALIIYFWVFAGASNCFIRV